MALRSAAISPSGWPTPCGSSQPECRIAAGVVMPHPAAGPPDPAPFQCGLPPGDTDEHVITGGAFKVEDAAGEAAADAACDGETERASSRLMRPELTAGCEPLGPVARSG
jgi:hypothetical protein